MTRKASAPNKKRPVGRPTKYRPEYCEQLIECMKRGAWLNSFAAQIGVSRNTLDLWAARHEEFAEALAIGKAAAAAWWENIGRGIAAGKIGGPGSANMVIFAMKNLSGGDFIDAQRHEHVGRINHVPMSLEEAKEEARRRGLPEYVLLPGPSE